VPEQLAQLALGTLDCPLPGSAQSPAGTVDVEVELGHRGLIRGGLPPRAAKGRALEGGSHRGGGPKRENAGFEVQCIARPREVLRPLRPAAAGGRPTGSLPRRWAAATPTLNCCHVHIVLPWNLPLVTTFSRRPPELGSVPVYPATAGSPWPPGARYTPRATLGPRGRAPAGGDGRPGSVEETCFATPRFFAAAELKSPSIWAKAIWPWPTKVIHQLAARPRISKASVPTAKSCY
jgi:hypothetical protein